MKLLLNLIIFLPAVAAIACLLTTTRQAARYVALGTSIVVLVMTLLVTASYYQGDSGIGAVAFETQTSWIESINVDYRVGVDGLNLPLVVLTAALSVLVILASWRIEKAAKSYLALYLFLMTGMFGVFLALDLFLFYVFFELSLLPMYFLIGVWGGPRREYAAIKFFLFTLAGSVCLLIVMLGLYFITPEATGGSTHLWGLMDLQTHAGLRALFTGKYQFWAQVFFWLTFIAFAIKIPVAPLHTWLPDAHVEAPTPISMILAGVLLKMGGYALMRITYPIFPEAARQFWYFVAAIGVFSILYGALCAMGQLAGKKENDWKKLVALSSVSHMGYVVLGLAVMTRTAFDGAYYQMIAHGISSAMMFFLVGVVYDRAHHRDLNRFGGMCNHWPAFSGWAMVGFFAGMGLPGLCGFIGEIMVLLGTFEAARVSGFSPTLVYTFGVLAAGGVILTAGYILWMFQNVFMGETKPEYEAYEPVNKREYFIMVVLGIAAIVFGIVPAIIFNLTGPTFTSIMQTLSITSGGG
jgi:NADH-quinone oxidoreductase subunit M